MDTNYSGYYVPEHDKLRESYFLSLMHQHKGLIYCILKSYQFIRSKFDEDDYYQQVMMYAWLRFHKYHPREDYGFNTWIRKTAKWAIFHYHNNYKKEKNHILYPENIASWYDEADTIYSEDHIEALHNAINNLPDDKKNIVQLFLNDEDLYKKSLELGHRSNYLHGKMSSIRKILLNNRQVLFPGMRVNERKLVVISSEYRNEKHWRSKPVEMLNMEGKFIKLFPSCMEAERAGFSSKNIDAVCNGKRLSAHGYRWRFQGEDRLEVLHRKAKPSGNPNKPKRPVDKLDMDGNYIRTYSSIYEAAKAGFESSLIGQVIRKKRNSHAGFKWRYAVTEDKQLEKQIA